MAEYVNINDEIEQIDDGYEKITIRLSCEAFEIVTNQDGAPFIIFKSKSDDVLNAVCDNNLDALRSALDNDDINRKYIDLPIYNHRFPPIFVACMRDQLPCVKALLDHGSYVLAANPSFQTGIHAASRYACMDTLEFLFEKFKMDEKLIKYMANYPTSLGDTPLHYAAKGSSNSLKVVNFLMAQGANPLIQNRNGQFPSDVCEDGETREILLHAYRLRMAEKITPLPIEVSADGSKILPIMFLGETFRLKETSTPEKYKGKITLVMT